MASNFPEQAAHDGFEFEGVMCGYQFEDALKVNLARSLIIDAPGKGWPVEAIKIPITFNNENTLILTPLNYNDFWDQFVQHYMAALAQ